MADTHVAFYQSNYFRAQAKLYPALPQNGVKNPADAV